MKPSSQLLTNFGGRCDPALHGLTCKVSIRHDGTKVCDLCHQFDQSGISALTGAEKKDPVFGSFGVAFHHCMCPFPRQFEKCNRFLHVDRQSSIL